LKQEHLAILMTLSQHKLKNLDVNLEFGDLAPAELNDLRQDVLAENQMYKTVSLNSKEWIAIDLVDNTESVCKKI
jgi:hypothetical protein